MKTNKRIIYYGIAILIIIISAIFLLPNFLLNNFGECHAENDACCKKFGSLSTCTHISMACDNENEEPVWKGCDNNCEHVVVCVEKFESKFGNDSEIGKACSIDSDCKLPMSYAAISSHKYEIKCVDSKCAIIDSLNNELKTKCCEECKNAFSKNPIDVGPEMASCGKFSSGQQINVDCKLFFENNHMTVSACNNYLTPFLPTQKESANTYMRALLSDKPEELELIDGCLRMNNGYENYLIVWHHGFFLSTDENGIIQVFDDKNNPIVKVGDRIILSGGGGEMSGGDSGDISAVSTMLPNDRCSGPYWILGEIEE